jgi:hypothetical protein
MSCRNGQWTETTFDRLSRARQAESRGQESRDTRAEIARRNFESRWKFSPGTLTTYVGHGQTVVRVAASGVERSRRGSVLPSHALPSLSTVGLPEARASRDDDGSLRLSFDLFDAMAGFLFEDFRGGQATLGRLMAVFRRAYYGVRPAIPPSVRLAVRRALARAQRRAAFPAWPVDTTLDDLQSCVVASAMLAAGSPRLPMLAWWPRGKRYAVILRHDVEDIRGVQNIPELRTIEEGRGLRSIWNFVPERYTFDVGVLGELREAGHEIGVHGLHHDGREFSNYDAFLRRAPRINRYLESWESRAFAAPSAIRRLEWIAEHLKLDFDMSAPTAEVIGAQPGGCCTVFPFFLKREIVELPMTMQQDHTLFEILKHSDLHIWHENVSIIRELGGVCVVTTHPDYMLTYSRRAAYASFLDSLMGDADAWIVLPSEVMRWWRDRAASQLILTSDQPRVAGPLAHRGTVAWIEPAADVRVGINLSPGAAS